MTHAKTAIVAGAGIGGLSTALALGLAGSRVHVMERAAQAPDMGAGIQISPNATRILNQWGVLDALEDVAMEPEALSIRRAQDGAQLIRMPLGAVARARWGMPHLVVHRADLQKVLLDKVATLPNIKLHYGAEIAGFADSQSGVEVAVHTALDTQRFEGDVLIGADGQRSTLREKLSPNRPGALGFQHRAWSGRAAWRALIDVDNAPGFALWQETNLWLGRKSHLVHYPLRNGTIVNVVAITQEPANFEDTMFYDEGVTDGWSQAGDPDVLLRRFSDWHPDAQALLAAADSWQCWPLFDTVSLEGWSRGRVTLLGDAAHPMLPFLAQGSAQAIEDAAALAWHVAQPSHPNAKAALAAYQDKRMARTTAIQLASRQQGRIYHMGGIPGLVRDQVLGRMNPLSMIKKLDWIYDYRGPSGAA